MIVKVFDASREARAHGPGGIFYHWRGDGRQFPEDVASVFIVMPVNISDSDRACYPVLEWTVDRPNPNGAQWSLSGTAEAPTLSPSLHWVGFWHGWLREGRLESC